MKRIFAIFLIFSSMLAFAQFSENDLHKMPPKPPGKFSGIFFWRGKRMMRIDEEFSVRFVRSEDCKNGFLNVDLVFSRAIDPRSLSFDCIQIDKKPLHEKTRVQFSKKGDVLRIKLPHKNRFSIFAKGIKSFDGRIMIPLELANVSANDAIAVFNF